MKRFLTFLMYFTLCLGTITFNQPVHATTLVSNAISIEDFTTSLPKVSVKSSTSLTIQWEKVSGATSYRVLRSTTQDGTYREVGRTSSLSFVNSGLTSGKTYYYQIAAYKSSKRISISEVKAYAALATPSVSISSSTKNGYQRVRWNAIKGATGYRIYMRASSKDSFQVVGETTELEYVQTPCMPGVTYEYKVKAYKESQTDRIYGKSSKITSRLQKISSGTIASITNEEYGTLTLQIAPVTNATGYRIYRSTSKTGTYKYLSDSIDTIYNDTNIISGRYYYYKVKPYYVNPNTKARYYGTASEIVRNKSLKFITDKGYVAQYQDGAWYIDGILIANKTYALSKTYGDGLTKQFNSNWWKMKAAAKADNITLSLVSGFRNYDLQKYLYQRYCAQDGQKEADTYSARPGHSEHQSGLVADLNLISAKFEKTSAYKWLQKNCYKYGFILRYPEGKTNETGYMYEPWHYRYVGIELATELYNDGNWITLEDYFGITSQY